MGRLRINQGSSDDLEQWIDQACGQDPLDIEIDEFNPSLEPALTADDIEVARLKLSSWQDACAFKSQTDGLCSRISGNDWFNRPQLKFLHDAFVLARFARDAGCESVMLSKPSEQWPDGYVRRRCRVHRIEIVSTHGGRKLGEEYRNPSGFRMDPIQDWIKRAETIPDILDRAILRKVHKRYAAPCWLVVYLNIDEWGIRQKEIEKSIETIKLKYAQSFEAISVRWKGYLY